MWFFPPSAFLRRIILFLVVESVSVDSDPDVAVVQSESSESSEIETLDLEFRLDDDLGFCRTFPRLLTFFRSSSYSFSISCLVSLVVFPSEGGLEEGPASLVILSEIF